VDAFVASEARPPARGPVSGYGSDVPNLPPFPLLFALLAAGPAFAETAMFSMDGALLAGSESRMLLVVHEGGLPEDVPTPALSMSEGRVLATLGRVQPGVYAYDVLLPPRAEGGRLTFEVGLASGETALFPFELQGPPEPAWKGPRRVEASAGDLTPVELAYRPTDPSLHARAPLDPTRLSVFASEGKIESVTARGGDLRVLFRPEPNRRPRVALVGIWDPLTRDAPPTFTPVLLVGRPKVPFETEPEAQVWISVGSRSYGPFTAGRGGAAIASVEVWPGEDAASVRIVDRVGNEQSTSLSLNPDPKGTLLLFSEPGRPEEGLSSPIHMAASGPSGSAWTGASPRCRLVPGGSMDPLPLGPGLYRLSPMPLPGDSFLDMKVDCELQGGLAAASTRVLVGRGIPSRIVLRTYPRELSADFPLAQLQAVIEDRVGDRLPVEGLRLEAERGRILAVNLESGALRADYDGTGAVETGLDRIHARYDHPVHSRLPARLGIHAGAMDPDARSLILHGRVQDEHGGPVAGLPVELRLGAEVVTVTSDARGWATARLPLDPSQLLYEMSAAAAGLRRVRPFLPRVAIAEAGPEAADLEAMVEIPITAGRVREVRVSADPPILQAGPGAISRVTVRLVDRLGNVIRDEAIQVRATMGEVGALENGADGSFSCWYRPPEDLSDGLVRLTVQGRDGAFAASTEIRVVPRPLRTALGIQAGVLSNFGAILSPVLEANVERRLPFGGGALFARLSFGIYRDQREFTDESTGGRIRVDTNLFPTGLSLLARREKGLLASWVGAGILLVPLSVDYAFGAELGGRSVGMAGPGVSILGGSGYRIGSGELGAELKYAFVNAEQGGIAYSGSLGGLAAVGTYRIIF
jgi:hypothetical protein